MISDFFTETYTVLTASTSEDEMGNKKKTFAESNTTFKGQSRLLNAREQKVDAHTQLETTHSLSYPLGVLLLNRTRVRRSDGQDFIVLFPEAQYGHHNKTLMSIV